MEFVLVLCCGKKSSMFFSAEPHIVVSKPHEWSQNIRKLEWKIEIDRVVVEIDRVLQRRQKFEQWKKNIIKHIDHTKNKLLMNASNDRRK